MNLTIIGGGRAAWAFGRAWQDAGWVVDRVALRTGSTSRVPELLGVERVSLDDDLTSEVVLVAVPDDALSSHCPRVAERAPATTWLLHPSGSHDSSLFGQHERAFSLHPLRALPRPGAATGLADALLVFEGNDSSLMLAKTIADGVGARFARVSREGKPIYHAAAVIAANLVAAQLDVAGELMVRAGLSPQDLKNEIASLARSAIENWAGNDGVERFTGPVARGDVALVRRHLDHLSDDDLARQIYLAASRVLVRAMREEHPDDERMKAIEALLSGRGVP